MVLSAILIPHFNRKQVKPLADWNRRGNKITIRKEKVIREIKEGRSGEKGESLTDGSKRMKIEGGKWHKGVERWNHNAEGFKETVYIILLCVLFSKRVKG